MEQRLREKVYFSAGELVMVKHEIPNRPLMVVKSVDKLTMPKSQTKSQTKAYTSSRDDLGAGGLLGVTCFWFSANMELQQARFNTKDLTKDF